MFSYSNKDLSEKMNRLKDDVIMKLEIYFESIITNISNSEYDSSKSARKKLTLLTQGEEINPRAACPEM
jgi:hypothetical protein